MFLHVIEVKYLQDYSLFLKFNDGSEGELTLEKNLWGKAFEPLKNKKHFQKVRLDKEIGTISWPNGADFAPEFLKNNLDTQLV